MRVREGWHILWRTPEAVQVGVDPLGSLIIEGLTPVERDYLLRLADGPPNEPTPPRTRKAVALLRHLGVVEEDFAPLPPIGIGAAEAPTLTRLSLDPHAILRRRQGASFTVDGSGALVGEIASCLAASGVGRIRITSPSDDPAPHHPRSPRSSDAAQLAARLRTEHPHIKFSLGGGEATEVADEDLVVLVRPWQPDLTAGGALLAVDVPHLAVIVSELRVQVGPLVLPGRTACLRCIALENTSADPAWPALATQLSATPTPNPPRALLLRAAGLAAQAALTHLDGRGGGLTESTQATAVVVSSADLNNRVRRWEAAPECGCVGLQ